MAQRNILVNPVNGRKKLSDKYLEYWEKYLQNNRPKIYYDYKKDLEYKDFNDKRYRGYREFKKTWSCAICGFSKYPEALDFHHIMPQYKKFVLTASNWHREDFGDELQKCVCLCSNCHRHITKKQGKVVE